MEGSNERESSALGGLFQQIISDMKNGTPLWEDLVVKATKLHTCLRAALNAISAYLDAFQKIADAATNTRGATKELGTALTRICLRHKAVEARMRSFTCAIMDCLVVPLQDKIEDWKKALVNLDKEHTRDYKRARTELKKRSTDTLRLQKKARKGSKSGDLQRRVECSLQDVTERKLILEEIEKKAVRSALIEERSRFCLLVAFLKPVVNEELAMLSELSHLQEVVEQLEKHAVEPHSLPPASEQVISDLKNSDGWNFQTPPSSPGSLGSRKSSMCSISSLNSSSSGSTKSHHSPSHHYWHRSLSQHPVQTHGLESTQGLSSVSSRDSGFTSQDTLFFKNAVAKVSNLCEQSGGSNVSTPCGSGSNSSVPVGNPTATWPNLQETLQFERAASAILSDRPHTISSAYERGHQRPALTVYTFHAPEGSHSQPASPVPSAPPTPVASPQPSSLNSRPPIPNRCSSLERPTLPSTKGRPHLMINQAILQKAGVEPSQPMYVNMHELANLAASKAQELNFPPPPPPSEVNVKESHPAEKSEVNERDGSTSESSLESSSGYGSQTIQPPLDENSHGEDVMFSNAPCTYCTLPRRTSAATVRQRPFSTAGYPSSNIRSTLLRRGSIQGQKPPPPIRRTSSISMSARNVIAQVVHQGDSSDPLPPPPAFLLEGTTLEPLKNQNQNEHSMKNSSDYQRTAALDIAAELQRRAAQLTLKEKKTCVEWKHQGGSISVAETVRTLTELKHTPASPVSIRRTHSLRSQSAERKVEPGLIATISAKLAPVRRHSQDPPQLGKASRVRQWIAVRTLPDPALCHESLMEQIKRGTSLRKTRTVNDRSAPRIH